MRNVLLFGDSIRQGYDKSARKTLEGIANVYFPEENCKFAAELLRLLAEEKFVENEKVDVVHWNAGLWDCLFLFYEEEPHAPIEIYKYYIERICKRIKIMYPNAKGIFATSVRVQSEKMPKDGIRYNEDIEKYNAAAVEIVKRYGFEVNDLYALSATLPPEAHSDFTHYYTPMGTEAFTNQVLCHIGKALDLKEIPEYKEDLYTDEPVGF